MDGELLFLGFFNKKLFVYNESKHFEVKLQYKDNRKLGPSMRYSYQSSIDLFHAQRSSESPPLEIFNQQCPIGAHEAHVPQWLQGMVVISRCNSQGWWASKLIFPLSLDP